MGIKTADGKQNFKLASILVFSRLSSPSGIYYRHDRRCMQFSNSACKVIERVKYLSKGNAAPLANTVKLGGVACSASLHSTNLLKGLK
jgi:hypothetical protein